jgi:hypothetical protein
MTAWKQALLGLTGHPPLHVSLLNPCKAEVFVDSKVAPAMREALTKEGYLLQDHPTPAESDLARRTQVYLNGYFLLLRREALRGFSQELQLKLLDAALAASAKLPEAVTRKQWKFQIAKDRAWVLQDMEM